VIRSRLSGAKFDPLPIDASSPPGVSPEVYFDEVSKTYFLYTSANIDKKIYTSKDGVVWSEASNYRLPNSFDRSIVKMSDNNYRLYYASMMHGVAGTVQCSKQKNLSFTQLQRIYSIGVHNPGPLWMMLDVVYHM